MPTEQAPSKLSENQPTLVLSISVIFGGAKLGPGELPT